MKRKFDSKAHVSRGSRASAQAVIMAVAAVMLAACDTKVTNPGRYEDRFLDAEAAHEAVVNGAERALADALNDISYTTAAVTRELFPAGSTGAYGISPRQQQGILAFDDDHVEWTNVQRSRFVAEQGFLRFKAELASSNKPFDGYKAGARAALVAGYANRLLAENWCQIALDKGPLITSDSVLRRAESWFTTALAMATTGKIDEIKNAALAGRASVRVGLGSWAGAVADAAQVPDAFRYTSKHTAVEDPQFNMIYYAGASQPYRAHTLWRTQYDEYYTATKDPRVKWSFNPAQAEGDAAVLDLGKVPFHRQEKYTEKSSPINLSSGGEMRLIEIESTLRDGDYANAVTKINALRSRAGAPPISAASLEEAWTLFKRERGIELWLEGRRLGDRRRWLKTSTPGALHSLELPGVISKLSDKQSMCYEVPRSEQETNPNAR